VKGCASVWGVFIGFPPELPQICYGPWGTQCSSIGKSTHGGRKGEKHQKKSSEELKGWKIPFSLFYFILFFSLLLSASLKLPNFPSFCRLNTSRLLPLLNLHSPSFGPQLYL